MNRFLIFVLASVIFFLVEACEHHHNSKKDHHVDAGIPELDKGNRWKADSPTKEGFQKLKSNVSDFEKQITIDKSIILYNEGAKKFTEDINSIFKSCKMTGQGHIELHKYIALLLKDIELMKGNDLKSAEDSFQNLKSNINKFETYFE